MAVSLFFFISVQISFCLAATDIANLSHLYSMYSDLEGLILPPYGNPLLGHQNFTYGCSLALNEYLSNPQTTEIKVGSELSKDNPFPCVANFGEDPARVATVQVTYNWCHQNINGWQLSESNNLLQWIQPLVGFIIPSIVFSLNVPRRRRLNVPDRLFPRTINEFKGFLEAIGCALLAAIIVTIDTILWLLVVFAFSGPLLLSGLHEAWLDKKLLDYMSDQFQHPDLPIHMRANLLYLVLVGNLDVDSAWDSTTSISRNLEAIEYIDSGEPTVSEDDKVKIERCQIQLKSMLDSQYSFGSTIGAPVIFYIGSFIFATKEITSMLGDNDTAHAIAFGMWWMAIPHIAIVSGCLLGGNNPNTWEGIASNVPSQYSNSNDSNGRTDSSTTRQASIATTYLVSKMRQIKQIEVLQTSEIVKVSTWTKIKDKVLKDIYKPVHETSYKPSWMWGRGLSKRAWITRFYEEYKGDLQSHASGKALSRVYEIDLSKGDWLLLATFAYSLMLVPSTLGFLVAYYTPQIGLSCRSLTFAVYICSQSLLISVWVINSTWRDEDWRKRRRNSKTIHNIPLGSYGSTNQSPGSLDSRSSSVSQGKMTSQESEQSLPTNPDQGTSPDLEANSYCITRAQPPYRRKGAFEWFHSIPFSSIIYHFLLAIGLIAATFSGIGGTLMQIIGVYRNCLCKLNTDKWLHNRNTAMLTLSVNNSIDIHMAKSHWIGMGIAATGFLGFVCYIGWWYQRRLRSHFKALVNGLGRTWTNDWK